MGITKREIAAELGVSKRTIANYIGKLGLGNHVSRNGNTDILDDFAAAAIADALKNLEKPSRQPAAAAPAPVGITELKNNFASIAKRVHDTSVPCTVLKQGRAYVAIVPVDPGYRTMGKYACNQYTRVLRRLFTFCRNAHDHRITFVLRRRNEDYVAIAPLDPPDTED